MKDSVIKFFEVVRQDEKLSERLRELSEKIEEVSQLSSELGRERGFDFEPARRPGRAKNVGFSEQGRTYRSATRRYCGWGERGCGPRRANANANG